MQNIGQAWLVLELTKSPFMLGMVSAIQFLPMMLFSLFAGPFIDRLPKRRLLLVTQTMLMALAAILAAITLAGVAQYWMVLVLALVLGFVNTLDIPTRQAMVIELAGREHLMNAISLNSAAFNLARIIGPAVAGLLIAAIGIGPCFLLNALSFLGPLAALLAIDPEPEPATAREPVSPGNILRSTREGLYYIACRPTLFWPILLLAIVGTVVINFNVVIPTFARQELAGDATRFGFLMTALGGGSFLAAITLAARSRRGPQVRALAGGALGMSICFALTGLQHDFWLSCLLLAGTGFLTITFTASCNAWVQMNADDHMRGRVMSVYALVFGGLTPIGSLYAGQLIDATSASVSMLVSGGIGLLATLAVAGLVWRRRQVAAPD